MAAPSFTMRGCAFPVGLLILAAAATAPGCAANKSMTACGGCAGRHVEIFAGLGGYMQGSEQIQQKLARRGICSHVSWNPQAHQVSRRILARRARGDCGPIVLAGYATGGHGVMQVASDLAACNVRVDAVILIDPSFFEPVCSNVDCCFVAYRPEYLQYWNPIMRGLPVKVASNRTQVVKVNLRELDRQGRMDRISHVTITSDEWVQDILVNRVAAAFNAD